MHHVSAIVLSEATGCPLNALSLDEDFSTFGVSAQFSGRHGNTLLLFQDRLLGLRLSTPWLSMRCVPTDGLMVTIGMS